MTKSEIQCFKDSIDKLLEIETTDGERDIARILFLIHDEEYDERELLYQVVSSNVFESYLHCESAGGCAPDFDKIVSVLPFSDSSTNRLEARS